MEAALFLRMLSDKSAIDLKKLNYKYPDAEIVEFTELLKISCYMSLPIMDFKGRQSVYMDRLAQVRASTIKTLLRPQSGDYRYGIKAMEEEIVATLAMENINPPRESVKKILNGYAPSGENENCVYGMKKGLDFISDTNNRITTENIFRLYQMTFGDFLNEDDKLAPGQYYRHDAVFVMGQSVEHTGLAHQQLAGYMETLIAFINEESEINELLKAAAIHFYIGYLHPYFDGNGRMARLLHLWYLVQQGYASILFVSISGFIEKSRNQYYNAYTLVEENEKISGVLDVTPFLIYFVENVYNQLELKIPPTMTIEQFKKLLDDGKITEKERDLWNFVLAAYGTEEFSTKRLEKDFGYAAYATIRGFVLKLQKLGVFEVKQYGKRVKYRLKD